MLPSSEKNHTFGYLEILLHDESGRLKNRQVVKNLIVTTGKNFIAASMIKTTTNSPAAMSHMALGMGTTSPVMANTALETEFTGGTNSRVALSASVLNNVTTYTATFGAGNGTGNVSEAGIFNASSGGTMLSRVKFSPIPKEANDVLTINWNIVQD